MQEEAPHGHRLGSSAADMELHLLMPFPPLCTAEVEQAAVELEVAVLRPFGYPQLPSWMPWPKRSG